MNVVQLSTSKLGSQTKHFLPGKPRAVVAPTANVVNIYMEEVEGAVEEDCTIWLITAGMEVDMTKVGGYVGYFMQGNRPVFVYGSCFS